MSPFQSGLVPVAAATLVLLAACGSSKTSDEIDAGTDAGSDAGAVDPCGGRCSPAETCLPDSGTCCAGPVCSGACCGAQDVCEADAGSCCTPNCTGMECGANGCGGVCGTCDAGVCDDAVGLCAVDCFPNEPDAGPDAGTQIVLLGPVTLMQGPSAPGAVTCNLDNVEFNGDAGFPGLASTGTTPLTLDGQRISVCVVADLGRSCLLGPEVGAGFVYQAGSTVCGVSGGPQCDLPQYCGSMPGTSAFLFGSADLKTFKSIATDSYCSVFSGAGGGLFVTPVTATVEWVNAKSIRYLVACRPFDNCSAGDAELLIDDIALMRTWP
jgi:hypothetical protein